jgi:branched-chain amino acid transport system permease protein
VIAHKAGIVPAIPGFLVFFLIILLGGCIASLLGIVIGAPTLRLRGDYLAIATLGFNEIFKVSMENMQFLGGAKGYSIYNQLGNQPPLFQSNLIWIYLFVVISIYVIYRIMKSFFGRNLLSIREDEIASESMGINISKYKVFSFVVGSFLAGAAGVLYVMYDRFYASPKDFGFLEGIPILLMIVLGGLGSMTGAVLGAVLLTVLLQFLKLVPGLSAQPVLIYALLLIVMMVLKPSGFLGRKEIADFEFYKKFMKQIKNKLGLNRSGS